MDLVVLNARPEHAEQMEELQRVCFPTLSDDERFKAAHFLKHQETLRGPASWSPSMASAS